MVYSVPSPCASSPAQGCSAGVVLRNHRLSFWSTGIASSVQPTFVRSSLELPHSDASKLRGGRPVVLRMRCASPQSDIESSDTDVTEADLAGRTQRPKRPCFQMSTNAHKHKQATNANIQHTAMSALPAVDSPLWCNPDSVKCQS